MNLYDGLGLNVSLWMLIGPSGRSINEVGVTPDIKVENTKDEDKQLESAVNILNSSEAGKTVPKG